jgi:hypothetical protein
VILTAKIPLTFAGKRHAAGEQFEVAERHSREASALILTGVAIVAGDDDPGSRRSTSSARRRYGRRDMRAED